MINGKMGKALSWVCGSALHNSLPSPAHLSGVTSLGPNLPTKRSNPTHLLSPSGPSTL